MEAPRPTTGLLATPGRRKVLFGLLYFLEGAPIGFVFWALPTMLAAESVDAGTIGRIGGVLALPWAFKFLWAPLVDVGRSARFGERGWIVCAQLAMAASLLPLLSEGALADEGLLVGALLVHALAAATQDVAIDALAIRTTTRAERASLNAVMNAGMMGGRAVFASGALLAREHVGDGVVVGILLAVLLLGLLLSLGYRSPVPPDRGSQRLRTFARTLARVARSRRTWRLLAFGAFGGAAFEVLGQFAGPLMIDRGFEQADVGLFFAVPAWSSLIVGGFVGARLATRFGRRRALRAVGIALAGGVAATPFLLDAGTSVTSAFLVLVPVYLAIGAFTVLSYTLFMAETEEELGSTQFSAFMGATNLCESWAAAAGGTLVASGGFETAFGAFAVVSVLALFLIPGRTGSPSDAHRTTAP